ncbi:02d7f978-1715-47b3-a846-c8a4d5f6e392 [Sclerotinia trifoliorum]|uniref:Short-chain dehydrogenase/reductase ABA4 n=1 Tax=Sclerotinia trifoliorum TaxID=28548 RepID=A0A8H2VNG2_9HELO|nr:02d7f978-1715-47b3-a846-c8a4d5f6e392 [Sclerotinia trifoliorum]
MNSKTTDGFALITGAASGIGKNAAFSFAESGAAGILFADINEKGAEESAIESKKYASNPAYRAISIRVDITDENSVQAMVDAAIKEFGRIDYNVNSAGIGTSVVTGMAELPLAEFDNVLNVNMKGTVLCNRAVLKAMLAQEPREFQGRYVARSLGRGCIVNLGSANSYAAIPGKTSYTTAKHAVIGITKTAAVDYSKQGIRVNAVCPIWVEGPMTEHEAQVNPHLDQVVQAVVPLKRMAQADEVADAIQFLCSPAASFITGTGLIIDAGTGLTVRLI